MDKARAEGNYEALKKAGCKMEGTHTIYLQSDFANEKICCSAASGILVRSMPYRSNQFRLDF